MIGIKNIGIIIFVVIFFGYAPSCHTAIPKQVEEDTTIHDPCLILENQLGDERSVKFIQFRVHGQCAHGILNAQGQPEFFATTFKIKTNEFISLRISTPHAQTLMDLFTNQGKKPLMHQDPVISSSHDFYEKLDDNHLFGCSSNRNHSMFFIVHQKDGTTTSSSIQILNYTPQELWTTFSTMVACCVALKNHYWPEADELVNQPAIDGFKNTKAFAALLNSCLH